MSEEAEVKPAPRVKKITVELLYDYWDENEDRHAAGSKIDLPEEGAIEIVNEGKAKLARKGS